MKFGIHLDCAQPADAIELLTEWRRSVVFADQHGFDYVSVVDHHVPFPSFRPANAPLFDPWQLLATYALETKHLALLTLVSNGSVVHPTKLAKQAATLDVLSGGRAILGIGAGGYTSDEDALGIHNRSQKERNAQAK